MSRRVHTLAGLLLAGLLAACSDATAPAPMAVAAVPAFAKAGTVSSGGSGSGGSSTDSASAPAPVSTTPEVCGAFSSQIQAYSIVVYTTRTGIGFTGTATNCGSRKVSFEVVVQDLDPDPACTVEFPHFIAQSNTDPGMTVTWQANSTLVPCQGKTHDVVLTLWDTRTNTKLAERTASAFL